MNKTIDAFLAGKEIAVAGASQNDRNFGLSLMKEFEKAGYNATALNPKYEEVNGKKCYPAVSDLPDNIENLVLAVNPERAMEIIKRCIGTGIKRVWLIQGVGNGSYSAEAVKVLKANNIEYVYGFCPMMFFGKGIHKFHYWLRKNLGKVPVEFSKN